MEKRIKLEERNLELEREERIDKRRKWEKWWNQWAQRWKNYGSFLAVGDEEQIPHPELANFRETNLRVEEISKNRGQIYHFPVMSDHQNGQFYKNPRYSWNNGGLCLNYEIFCPSLNKQALMLWRITDVL